MWPRFGPVLLYLVYSWLTLGLPLSYLWPKFGKQERTTQVPSFFTVYGPEQGVGSGPELKSMWPRYWPVLLYLVYSWLTLGLPLAYFWPKSGKQERTAQVPSFHAVCGPDESVRCGPDLGLRNFAIWDLGWSIVGSSPWIASQLKLQACAFVYLLRNSQY